MRVKEYVCSQRLVVCKGIYDKGLLSVHVCVSVQREKKDKKDTKKDKGGKKEREMQRKGKKERQKEREKERRRAICEKTNKDVLA